MKREGQARTRLARAAVIEAARTLFLEQGYGATTITALSDRSDVPVATVYRVESLDEAIAVANDSPFGLSSNVWTTDPGEQERFMRDMVAGAVFVNGMTTSFPDLPFGGVKTSGYGRELSAHGIREFCNVKAIWVA